MNEQPERDEHPAPVLIWTGSHYEVMDADRGDWEAYDDWRDWLQDELDRQWWRESAPRL